MAILIAPAHLHFIIPVIAKLYSDIIGFYDSILSTSIILIIRISRIGKCIDIIAQPRNSNSSVLIKKIDAGSRIIAIIGTITTGGSSELSFFTIWFSYNIDRSLFFTIVKPAQLGLIALLVIDLYIINDFCRYTFQSQFYIISKKRSEEHTSELQSRGHLVCRLLLEK